MTTLAPPTTLGRQLGIPLNSPVMGDETKVANIDPSSTYVAFTEQQGAVVNLFTVLIDGTAAPMQVNAVGSTVRDFAISSVGSIVYIADETTNGVFDLFSRTSIGGVPGTKTTLTNIISGGEVKFFQIATAIPIQVVYVADQDTMGIDEIYRVPIAGGASVKLNNPILIAGDVLDFVISSDGTKVVYRGDLVFNFFNDLFSATLVGAPTISQLSPPGNSSVQPGYQISLDSNFVAFIDGTTTVYGVAMDGTGRVVVSDPVQGSVQPNVSISQDAFNNVLFTQTELPSNIRQLYKSPITGGVPVQLNDHVTAGSVQSFIVRQSTVAYRAQAIGSPSIVYLFSVDINAGVSSAIQLTSITVSTDIQFSPNGTRLVYRGGANVFSIPVTGPLNNEVKLNPALVSGGEVKAFIISADSQTVVYLADQDIDGVDEIYGVPLAGPAGLGSKLNSPNLMVGEGTNNVEIAPNSTRVIYIANPAPDEFTLFSSEL